MEAEAFWNWQLGNFGIVWQYLFACRVVGHAANNGIAGQNNKRRCKRRRLIYIFYFYPRAKARGT
jgi:hypothetical protein